MKDNGGAGRREHCTEKFLVYVLGVCIPAWELMREQYAQVKLCINVPVVLVVGINWTWTSLLTGQTWVPTSFTLGLCNSSC